MNALWWLRSSVMKRLARLLALVWPLVVMGNALASDCEAMAALAQESVPHGHEAHSPAGEPSHAEHAHQHAAQDQQGEEACCCDSLSSAPAATSTVIAIVSDSRAEWMLPAPRLVHFAVFKVESRPQLYWPPPAVRAPLFLLLGRLLN